MAEGHSFFAVGTYDVSRDGKLLAWADDTVGRRQYVLHIKDLKSGKILARPERHEMEPGVEEQLIVEFYSR